MARTARTKQLTALAVKRYVEGPPTGKELHDGGGLYLRRREAGAYWYLRITAPGSKATQWHRMFPDDPQGAYPHKTLANAREEAERLWSIRRQGLDPRIERRRQIVERQLQEEASRRHAARQLTVRQLFDRWASSDLEPHVRGDGKRIGRKDGGRYVREQFERRVFPALGDTPAADVSKAAVLAILDAAKAEGKLRTANMLLADLKQMFRFAAERELVDHSPVELIQKRKIGGKDVKRDRVLSDAELRTLFTKLPHARLSERTRLGILLTLATGCRVGELIGGVWNDAAFDMNELRASIEARNAAVNSGAMHLGIVDMANRAWYLPSTKNQRDHTIHLSTFALEQLRQLHSLREVKIDGSGMARPVPWLFPNSAATLPVDVKSLGKQLADRQRSPDRRLKNRTSRVDALALPGGRWTAHDLRRSAATLMSQLGISNDVINECLNHMKPGITGVYIHDRRLGEQAAAFEALGVKLASL